MKSRRELKALLLTSVAALTLMSGCSKDKDTSEKTENENYSYYIEVNGDFVELENVEYSYVTTYDSVYIHLIDDTEFKVPAADFYRFDKNSELQQELIRKLTK